MILYVQNRKIAHIRSIGGQFTGNFCARELKKKFYVTVVDAKEPFFFVFECLLKTVSFSCLDIVKKDEQGFFGIPS